MRLLTHNDVKELNHFLSEVLGTSLHYVCDNYDEIMPTYRLIVKDKYVNHTYHPPVPYTKEFEKQVRQWCEENVHVTDLGYIDSVQRIMVYNEEYYNKVIKSSNYL